MADIKEQKKVKKNDSVSRLRLSVFRSNYGISVQAIDDSKGITIASASSKELKEKATPTQLSEKTGELLAKKLTGVKISKVHFDRGQYRYHGRVKALADGIRKGGLQF